MHTISLSIKADTKRVYTLMRCLFILHKEPNHSVILDTVEYVASSTFFFWADCYFSFMITGAENVPSHKYTAQNGRSTIRAISDISDAVGNSVLIPNQNSLDDFFFKVKQLRSITQTTVLKVQHANCKAPSSLIWYLPPRSSRRKFSLVFCNEATEFL